MTQRFTPAILGVFLDKLLHFGARAFAARRRLRFSSPSKLSRALNARRELASPVADAGFGMRHGRG